MDPMRELPMGLGLALCANQQAAACFERMSPEEQRQVVEEPTPSSRRRRCGPMWRPWYGEGRGGIMKRV